MVHSRYNCPDCEYILDIYFQGDTTHVWTKTRSGETNHYPLAYHPKIYVAADLSEEDARNSIEELQYLSNPSYPRSLREIAQIVSTHPDVVSVEFVKRFLSSHRSSLSDVVEVEVYSVKKLPQLILDFKARRINMFNIDINPRQQFFIDTGSRPMCAVHIETKKRGLVRKFDTSKYVNDYDPPKNTEEIASISLHEDLDALDYYLPPLGALEIKVDINRTTSFPKMSDSIRSITLNHSFYEDSRIKKKLQFILQGGEGQILQSLLDKINELDPDFLIVAEGDKFIMAYLAHRAKKFLYGHQFVLGRLKNHPLYVPKDREGQSYMTYGQIMHRDPIIYLPGRVHIDGHNSFFFHDSSFEGVIELARMSGTPPARVSRASIGTVLTGVEMLINAATIPATLLPPIKAKGEQFKPADHLLISDNGGLIYDAVPGIYTGVWTIDFTSLYPFIMLNHNISSETVLCEHEECRIPMMDNPKLFDDDPLYYANQDKIAQRCHQYDNIVPEVDYHICTKRVGIVTRTMSHILLKRVELKRRRKIPSTPREKKIRYKRMDSAMKWILVSCLEGSTRVLVRKNGKTLSERIDTIVNGFSDDDNLEALGIDEFGRPEFKRVKNVIKTKPITPVHQIKFRGGKSIVATGDHLWPVITKNGWKNVRTDQLTDNDWVPQLEKYDQEVSYTELDIISELSHNSGQLDEHELPHLKNFAELANSPTTFTRVISVKQLETLPEYVYCFELDSPTPWFMIEGNLITHNCFGYLGFKNARWGAIEAHQAVTAYARRYLVQAKLIANQAGYRLIGGITDSLFLQATRPELDNQESVDKLIKTISDNSGIPIDCEGRFRWVIFCNVKDYTRISALNRYFGYFDHGEFKLRGIRHRQRRVTVLEKKFQETILDLFIPATSDEEFKALLPRAEKVLIQWQNRLRNRLVDTKDLIIKLKSGKGSGGYKAKNTHQAIVTRIYMDEGRPLEAGENFYYIVREDKGKGKRRVTIGPNVEADSHYDIAWYCKLLENAFLELLETPQRQYFGEIKYDGKPRNMKLHDFGFEYHQAVEIKPDHKAIYNKIIQNRKKETRREYEKIGLDAYF